MGTLKKKLGRYFGGGSEKDRGDSGIFDGGEVSEISQPYNLVHEIHVGYNPQTHNFEGVPEPWLNMLKSQIRFGCGYTLVALHSTTGSSPLIVSIHSFNRMLLEL